MSESSGQVNIVDIHDDIIEYIFPGINTESVHDIDGDVIEEICGRIRNLLILSVGNTLEGDKLVKSITKELSEGQKDLIALAKQTILISLFKNEGKIFENPEVGGFFVEKDSEIRT